MLGQETGRKFFWKLHLDFRRDGLDWIAFHDLGVGDQEKQKAFQVLKSTIRIRPFSVAIWFIITEQLFETMIVIAGW